MRASSLFSSSSKLTLTLTLFGRGLQLLFAGYEFFGRVTTRDPLLYGIILLPVIFQEVLQHRELFLD